MRIGSVPYPSSVRACLETFRLGSRKEKERMEQEDKPEQDNQPKQAQKSEVARLLAQIDSEYEAARAGLSGLSQGSSQHRFITHRMEIIADFHTQLQALVGEERAMELMSVHLDTIEEQPTTSA